MIKKTVTIKEAFEMFKKMPLLLEEFIDDTDNLTSYEEDSSVTLEKISPLLSREKMTEDVNAAAEIALNAVPLYHISSPIYGVTRDPSILQVPRPLQTDFWKTLFCDALGTEYNSVLLNSFNKLKYAYMSEQHILNRLLIKKASRLLPTTTSFVLASDETDKINSEYLDKVINLKLDATYSLCNYSPTYSGVIEDWMESLYISGKMTYEERVREQNLYKVQDLKTELIRRKFAGSASLYSIILSSINRRGTYAPAVPLKTVESSSEFKDNRLIRALYIPGLTVDLDKLATLKVNPIKAFTPKIPLRTVIPIYYSSSGSVGRYDSDAFDGFVEGITMDDYLRANTTVIAWDNLQGITDPYVVRDRYPRLDSMGAYLDGYDSLAAINHTGDPERETMYLDTAEPMFDLSVTTASFFDIQADDILYHSNSQQKILGNNYPYVTYTVAKNNSLSMMDLPWLEYASQVLDNKTRVQEKVRLGVQISRLVTDRSDVVRENYTVVTFDTTINNNFFTQASSYSSSSKYCYLWNVSILYSIQTFNIMSIEPRLITYMLLQVDDTTLPSGKHKNHPSYDLFTSFSTGLIPFTYSELNTNDIVDRKLILNDDELVDDLYDEEYSKAIFLFTDKENVAIAKDYFARLAHDLIATRNGEAEWYNRPVNDRALKHVIFGLQRDVKGVVSYDWSEPMRLYPKGNPNIWDADVFKNYKPDWMGLVSYFNPYLNFVTQSASPIRHKEVPLRGMRPATEEQPLPEEPPASIPKGPSLFAALTDLNVQRGYTRYINITGDDTKKLGTYLHRVRQQPSDPDMGQEIFVGTEEKLQVWGDNRPYKFENNIGYTDDAADNWESATTRSVHYKDSKRVYALYFTPGSQYDPQENVATYYTLQPSKNPTDWDDWVWNNPREESYLNGLTACVDCHINPSTTDLYFISQRGATSGTINAAFDWYYSTDKKLIFKVYPTGVLTKAWQVSIDDAEFITQRQTQISISYKHDVIDENTMYIEQSIIADRVWAVAYKVVKKTADSTYSVYETTSSYSIEGLTPESITMASPYTGFFLGQILKYKGDTGNTLREVCVFNRNKGYDSFLGTLYDFRLYRRGVSYVELILLNSGTRRELYSYSPSLYKLSYQHYSDPGILRRVTPVLPEEAYPRRVRIFNRSVWDSILTDMYPTSAEEMDILHPLYNSDYRDPKTDIDIYTDTGIYKEGVLDQILVQYYEAMSEVQFPNNTSIFYRGNSYMIGGDDKLSFVQTTIYPIQYNKEPFDSTVKLKVDVPSSSSSQLRLKAYSESGVAKPEGASLAKIPSSPSGNTLQYGADIDVNFRISTKVDMAAPLDSGDNIIIKKLKDAGEYVALHANTSAEKVIKNNLLLLPFYLPSQGSNDYNSLWERKLINIDLEGLVLDESITTLLKSDSYYNEVQIPLPFVNSDGEIKYTSRWDAIRTLREGTYYVTTKYPIQFRPFVNAEQHNNIDVATIYATVRFKIVVRGETQYYTEDLMDPRDEWREGIIENTIKNRYQSVDNHTYPHRKIYIDLYTLTTNSWSGKTWGWDKVASNYDTSVQTLNPAFFKEAYLTKKIHAYFSPSYKAPLFVYKNNAIVADVTEVKIKGGMCGVEQKLKAKTEGDLSNLTLLSGRTYKLVFDYSSYTPEISYSEQSYIVNELMGFHLLTNDELNGYNKMISVLDDPNKVFYNSSFNYSSQLFGYDMKTAKTGFLIQSDGTFADPATTGTCALGDPYTTAADTNQLVSWLPIYKEDFYNLGYFSYKQEDADVSVVAPAIMLSDIQTLHTLNDYDYLAKSEIDEYTIIKGLHNSRLKVVRDALVNTNTGSIKSLSYFVPVVIGGDFTHQEPISSQNFDLMSYNPTDVAIPINGSYFVERVSPLGNNEHPDPFVWNESLYTHTADRSFYDEDEGKDVYTMEVDTAGDVTFTQKSLPPCKGQLSFDIKGGDSVKVYIGGEEVKSATLTAGEWNTITVAIETTTPTTLAITAEDVATTTQITNLSLRRRKEHTLTHRVGLSNTLQSQLSQSSVPTEVLRAAEGLSRRLIVMKDRITKQYFVVQFGNTTTGAADSRQTRKAMIINNYSYNKNDESEASLLLSPWKKRLIFKQDSPEDTKIYAYELDATLGGKVAHVARVEDTSMFTVSEDPDDLSIYFNQSNNSIEFGGTKGLMLDVNAIESISSSNLKVNTENPVTITNEQFSLISNCAKPSLFESGLPSPITITNIQILNDIEEAPTILYELEYLPIIYDESRHHLSFNLLVKSN